MQISPIISEEQWNAFFQPRSVLLIGPSRNELNVNGMVLHNLIKNKYSGEIFVVHPFRERIQGCQSWISIKDMQNDIKVPPELVIILTVNDIIPNMEAIGAWGTKSILIEADPRFVMEKTELARLKKKIEEIWEKGVAIIGPGSIGLLNFPHKFSTSSIPTRSTILNHPVSSKFSRRISYYAQSGGLAGGWGWKHPAQPLSWNKIVHIGLGWGISESLLVRSLLKDNDTKILLLYLRSVDADLIRVLKDFVMVKPIIFYYIGNEENQLEHLCKIGCVKAEEYQDLFYLGYMFSNCPHISNPNIGVIGPSSGAIQLVTSKFSKYGLNIAKLSNNTKNPIDFWPPKEYSGEIVADIYRDGIKLFLQEEYLAIIIFVMEFFDEIDFNLTDVLQQWEDNENYKKKLLLICSIQGEESGLKRLRQITENHGIPLFEDKPEQLVRCLGGFQNYFSRFSNKNQIV